MWRNCLFLRRIREKGSKGKKSTKGKNGGESL